jgi:hypothetical protein
MKKINNKIKKLDILDISLIKISVVFFVLFLINIWSSLLDLIINVHWLWFLIISVLTIIRPLIRIWFKK